MRWALDAKARADVVPVGDANLWRHDPFPAEITPGVLYGRGASDMKTSLAAFVVGERDLALPEDMNARWWLQGATAVLVMLCRRSATVTDRAL